jgi:hypothetical protein
LLGEKPASGAVRVEVDGDNDSLKTYFMPAVQLQQWVKMSRATHFVGTADLP